MHSQTVLSAIVPQSFSITVNKATSRHSVQFQVYQCSVNEKPKNLDHPTASDTLLKDIEQLLKKYNKGYKTEVECTVVGPTFSSYYHSKFNRFIVNNLKRKEKEFLKIFKKLNNKNLIKFFRQLQKEKELKPTCTPLLPIFNKKFIKKFNNELSKNRIPALDNNKNLPAEIASLLKCLCNKFSNEESKKNSNNITPNVHITEDLDKYTPETKSANIKDNKNLINNEKDEGNIDCLNDQPNTKVSCMTKNCLKNFRARLISLKEKPNKLSTCLCRKKDKKLRQKGTNTYVAKDLRVKSPITISRVENKHKPYKNKNKSTNTKTDRNNNLTNLSQSSCENCLLLQNLNKSKALNTCTKDEISSKNTEFYDCLGNKDVFKRQNKCISNRIIKKIENRINLQDTYRKEKLKLVLFPFKKKCKSDIENCNEIVLDFYPPTIRNKIMFKADQESLIPNNNIKPINYNNMKVQTDKKILDCTRRYKNQIRNKKTLTSFTNSRANRNTGEEYDQNHSFINKIRNFCKIFEGKKTITHNVISFKLSPSPSLSIEPNYSLEKSLFSPKSKGIKLTIGRVAEENRALCMLNPATSFRFHYLKNEMDLTDNIMYQTALPETLSEKNSIICNLDFRIDNANNKISLCKLELKRCLPNSIPLLEPTTSYCFTTNYNIRNKSLMPYQAPNCIKYIINTSDFPIFNWKNLLSDIQIFCPMQFSMKMLRSCQELKSETNIWYLQENENRLWYSLPVNPGRYTNYEISYETKSLRTTQPNTESSDATQINTKYYFEWLYLLGYNHFIGSSYDLFNTCSVKDNNFEINRKKQAEYKFCLYLFQCHEGDDYENRMRPLTYRQSEHTCCMQNVYGISNKSNCNSCDNYPETSPKCSACTSCQLQWLEEPNNDTKIRRKLIKKCTLKPIRCKKTITEDGSICLTCDYNSNSNKKHNDIWSKLNQKFTKKCDKIEETQTELFLGIKHNEHNESSENELYELTFSDFEKMSERQLRCIISQLSKVISPYMQNTGNNSNNTLDLSCCFENNNLNKKKQGIKFFLQPNDFYSNKLFRYFLRKKTK